MNKEQIKKLISLLEILALIVLLVCVIILVTQNMKLQKIKVQEQQAQQEIEDLNARIDELRAEYEYKNSPEYLEEWARQNGYIKPGEQQYIQD